MSTVFDGETLTQTGTMGSDPIDPSTVSFGLIGLTGAAITSKTPFLSPFSSIKGTDVKLVHGDRWQELGGELTENIFSGVTTTIGAPGLIAPGGGDAYAGQAHLKLTLYGDLTEKIGGNVNLYYYGQKDTVQVGAESASFFSTYTKYNNDDQYNWHFTNDSYVALKNDYKIVTDTKYRSVNHKVDHAKTVFSTASFVLSLVYVTKIAANLSVVSATLANISVVPVGGTANALKAIVGFHLGAKMQTYAGAHVALSTPFS